MHILITGAAGFIGSHLAARLLARGDEVSGLDNFDETLYPAARKHAHLEAFAGAPAFHFTAGDILDDAALGSLLSRQPDVVVHLAALAGVRPSLVEPRRYQRVNVEGTVAVLEACRRHRVTRLVVASSSSVYGAHDLPPGGMPVPFHEEDPALRPVSPYAASKRATELMCSLYSDIYGMHIAALRFFTVYGPRQRPDMAIHQFTRLIDAGQPVLLLGDGTSARDYTYIDDIIDGIVAAIDRCTTLPERFRIYNLGGGQIVTLSRLVEALARALGKPARCEYRPTALGDVPLTMANIERARNELGYRPQVAMEEGLARFVAWHRQMPR